MSRLFLTQNVCNATIRMQALILFLIVVLTACQSADHPFSDQKVYNANWKGLDSTEVFHFLAGRYAGSSPRLGTVRSEDSMTSTYSFWIDSLKENPSHAYFRLTLDVFTYTSPHTAAAAMQRYYDNLRRLSHDDTPTDPNGPSLSCYPVYYVISNHTIYALSSDYSSANKIDDCFNFLVSGLGQGNPADKGSIVKLRQNGVVEVN